MGVGGSTFSQISEAAERTELWPPALGDGELAEVMVDLARAQDTLALLFARCAAELESRGPEAWQGSVSAQDWIRHHCRLSGTAASDRVVAGRHLDRLPLTEAAVRAGEIGFAHLALIAHTAQWLGERRRLGQVVESGFEEQALLELAREQSVSRFRFSCEHARHAAAAGAYLADAEQVRQQRFLQFGTSGSGLVRLVAELDPEGGATVRAALEPLARRLGPEDDRGQPARMADALVEMASRVLDSGELPGQSGQQRPHLQVSVALETLRGLPGAPAAELEWTRPVPGEAARRVACDCTVHRVLLGGAGEVLDVGRALRVVPGATRRALVARDRGCRWPGCQRPAPACAAHHVQAWIEGGRTDVTNLVLLCAYHHRLVHEGLWRLALTRDGEVAVSSPIDSFSWRALAAAARAPAPGAQPAA